MCGFICIFLLSAFITHQSVGTNNLNRLLTAPAYEVQGNKNNIYNQYGERAEEWDNDDEKDFKDETRFGEEKYEDDDQEYGSRRLFEWFSRLFKSTTPHAQTLVTTTESIYTRELKERIFLKALHRNLSHILVKLSEVEKQVSYAMDQKEEYAILTKGKPRVLGTSNGFYFGDRKKRDTNMATAAGHIRKRETAKPTEESTKAVTEKSKEEMNVNTTECPCNVTSGRRLGSMPTPTEVKNKLLLYLQESFQEIKGKILSLRTLKQAFSDNISFKIGYILANIDTLEVSMLNLKNNMDKNKEVWQDNTILELYDTLKVSNQAVSGLIDSLKSYLEKLSYHPQMKPQLNLG